MTSAEVNRYARLGPAVQALIDDYDQIALALMYATTKEHLDRAEAELQQHAEAESADAAAGSYAGSSEHAIAHPEPWVHILFTSPDPTTANTSALNLRDHLAAEFDGVGMRISSNAVEGGDPWGNGGRLAQSGVDTPGCDCGHQGMGESWHGDTCDWKSIPPCDVCGVRGHSFEDCGEATAPELTAEEARALADELGTDLYRAQDALAFVEECCVIADRERRAITTADVRKWLKGARCGRQLAADGELDDTGLTEADIDRMMAAGIPVHIVTAPLTWTTAQQFYEPDEDPAAIQAAFEAGEKGVTAPPESQHLRTLLAAITAEAARRGVISIDGIRKITRQQATPPAPRDPCPYCEASSERIPRAELGQHIAEQHPDVKATPAKERHR